MMMIKDLERSDMLDREARMSVRGGYSVLAGGCVHPPYGWPVDMPELPELPGLPELPAMPDWDYPVPQVPQPL